MRFSIVISIVLSLPMRSICQELTIGDIVPETAFSNVVNYSKPQIDIEDTRGKIVLYDFWATNCGSCVASMPKMAVLQKEFDKDIKVIYVTYQSRQEVEKFYSKRPEFKKLGLPIITDESLMLKRFPCRLVPHVVWVGKDGIVKAITEGQEVTRDNILSLLKQNNLKLPLKKDIMDFNYDQPFSKADLESAGVVQQSLLTGPMKGLSGRLGYHKVGEQHTRLYATNIDLLSLVYHSLESGSFNPYVTQYIQRAIIDSSVSHLFRQPVEQEERDSKLSVYCYESIIEAKDGNETRQKLKEKLLKDIEAIYRLKIELIEAEQSCYILSASNPINVSTGQKEIDKGIDTIRLRNVNLRTLAAMLNSFDFDRPLIYEDDLQSLYSIKILGKYQRIEAMQEDLQSQGIQLTKGRRKIMMVQIKEASTPTLANVPGM